MAQRRRGAIQHPVVIVPAAVPDLRIVGVDPRADARRPAEIERRAVDRRELAGGNQRGVHRRETIGVDRQSMIEDVAASGEIEITVLCEVDDRRLVGRRVVVDRQRVRRRQRVRDCDVQRSRISFVSVLALERVGDTDVSAALERLGAPQLLVESFHAAVQMIRSVVRREMERRAVQRERALRDPVAVSADDRAEVRRPLEIVIQPVEPEDDIVKMVAAVSRLDRHDDGAV